MSDRWRTWRHRQKNAFLALGERYPDLLPLYNRLYPRGSDGPAHSDPHLIGRLIRELCRRYGIRDRMPRPIMPGDKRAQNKRIVAELAEEIYSLELNAAAASQVWSLRKAVWAIEDLEQDIGLIYKQMGCQGLECIPNVGPRWVAKIEAMIVR